MDKSEVIKNGVGYREGIPIDKGIKLNEDYLNEHYEKICGIVDHWITYPDCFLDTIAPHDCPIKLFFYQRIKSSPLSQ